MPDPAVLVRLVDELVWVLRREGFPLSTAQALDVARAIEAVGLERRGDVCEAVAAVVLQRRADRLRFDAVFEAFFALEDVVGRAQTLWQRLKAQGFTDEQVEALKALMEEQEAGLGGTPLPTPFRILLEPGAAIDRFLFLAGSARTLDAHSGLLLGFRTHALLAQLGTGPARSALSGLRARLREALGLPGLHLADALARELEKIDDDVRLHVRRAYEWRVRDLERARKENRLETTPFSGLSERDIEEVRRRVRRLAERLRGAARVRSKRARRGRVDPHRTLRSALRTGGVPFALVRKRKRRDRVKLVVLCDVSDSVRAAAAFLLEFTYAAQELFGGTRSFLFVSELGEATEMFARESVRVAVAMAWGGGVVRLGENSNYGRMFREFEARHLAEMDRRTTVIVLGDGRNNYHPPHAEVLERLRRKSRALLWLCCEPRGQWGQGDSAMGAYAPACTAVYEVTCAADLERVARRLVARR